MIRIPIFVLYVFAASAQTDGWIDLFPDEHFSKWTRIAIPPSKAVTNIPQWKVDTAHRLIICEGNGGHDMMRYNREFENFILHVEWRFTKIDDPGARYNSGVFVRNDADGTIWHQAQAGGDNGGYLFGDTLVNGEKKRVNLSKQMKENRIKPPGEWNTFDIRCEGRKIAVSTNGAATSVFDECEVPKGYIALEAEGYRIEFRNIRVKIL